jgi:hypothetical protein
LLRLVVVVDVVLVTVRAAVLFALMLPYERADCDCEVAAAIATGRETPSEPPIREPDELDEV